LSGVSLTSQVSGTLPTANGGTNLTSFTSGGVVYASSSSALATGSALTFNGTQLNVTASANSAVWMATINSNAGASADNQFIASNGANNAIMSMKGTGFTTSGIFSASNAFFGGTGTSSTNLFSTNGNVNIFPASTLAATFTTTGLGIGTSSPAYKLDVVGNSAIARLQSTGASQNAQLNFQTTVATWSVGQNITLSTGALEFYNGSLRATLDSSGNLGLGVTPSAWSGWGNPIFQLGGAGTIVSNTTVAYLGANFYYNAGYKYIAASAASYYLQNAGSHAWYRSTSTPVVGNDPVFSAAMTLDASGRVQIGTTSAAGMLTVVAIASTSYGTFDAPTSGYAYHEYKYNGTRYGLTGQANAIVAGGSATDWCVNASNNLVLGTGSTERARIDSSGNLLVGTTSAGGVGFSLTDNAGAICTTTQRANGTGATNMCLFVNPNGTVGTIQISGSSTSYNTSSDYRLKNTIAPMTGALAKVALLKPCTYKWNADGSDGEGFIAHELAEVVPQCVTGEKDAVDAEGNIKAQGIDTSFLVATLTAALQEQQAIIESLKARLDAANL
jgi:hypothetical protein